jgi:putative addiction module killer protein
MQILYYRSGDGRSPFVRWFERLDSAAGTKVSAAVLRLEEGNLSNVKSVGGGVFEYRIDWGPGYRMYFGRDGGSVIVLLVGGSKQRQQLDIEAAKTLWLDYKIRRRDQGP